MLDDRAPAAAQPPPPPQPPAPAGVEDDPRRPAPPPGASMATDVKAQGDAQVNTISSVAGDVIINQIKERVVAAPPVWTNPSHDCQLPAPLTTLAPAALDPARAQLATQRVLVVECVDSALQWAVAAAATAALAATVARRRGVLCDSHLDAGIEVPTSDDGGTRGRGEHRPRWGEVDLLHPGLAPGACVLFLELEGAAGRALIDQVFKTQGHLEWLGEQLSARARYLVLLPRGRAASSLGEHHAQRGFRVRPLQVSFLDPWLHRHYPDEAVRYAAALQEMARRGEWNHSEEAMYDALCRGGHGADGRAHLEALIAGEHQEPHQLARVRDALAQVDGATEPFLAAVFAATYLPGLGQQAFQRTVEALLTGRTRLVVDAGVGPRTVALADDWQAGQRAILAQAGIELQRRATGPRVLGFRGVHAQTQLKRALDDTPMFVGDQLERIRAGGLLFDRNPALADAVIDLIGTATVEATDQVDADWLLGLLLQVCPGLALPPATAAELLRPKTPDLAQLDALHALLRHLIDRHPLAAGQDDRGGESLVLAVLARLLRLGTNAAVKTSLELAYRLRDAPRFELWGWIRRVLAQGHGADALITRIVRDDPGNHSAAFHQVIAWVQQPTAGEDPTQAAAVGWFARWTLRAVRHLAGLRTADGLEIVEFLQRVVGRDGAEAGADLIATLLRDDVMAAVADERCDEGAAAIGLVLPALGMPDDNAVIEDGAGFASATWNRLVSAGHPDLDPRDQAYHLRAALALATWCELFADRPAVLDAMALHLRVGGSPERQYALAWWLGTLVEVMAATEDHLAAHVDWLRAIDARRRRIARFLIVLTGGNPS